MNPGALSAMAELFLMNGDMCAWLYTGSPAMHSEKITLFEPEASRLKKAGAGGYSNSFIAIRRRARACTCTRPSAPSRNLTPLCRPCGRARPAASGCAALP